MSPSAVPCSTGSPVARDEAVDSDTSLCRKRPRLDAECESDDKGDCLSRHSMSIVDRGKIFIGPSETPAASTTPSSLSSADGPTPPSPQVEEVPPSPAHTVDFPITIEDDHLDFDDADPVDSIMTMLDPAVCFRAIGGQTRWDAILHVLKSQDALLQGDLADIDAGMQDYTKLLARLAVENVDPIHVEHGPFWHTFGHTVVALATHKSPADAKWVRSNVGRALLRSIITQLPIICASLIRAEARELERTVVRRDSLSLASDTYAPRFERPIAALVYLLTRNVRLWDAFSVQDTLNIRIETAISFITAFDGVCGLFKVITTLIDSFDRMRLSPSLLLHYIDIVRGLYKFIGHRIHLSPSHDQFVKATETLARLNLMPALDLIAKLHPRDVVTDFHKCALQSLRSLYEMTSGRDVSAHHAHLYQSMLVINPTNRARLGPVQQCPDRSSFVAKVSFDICAAHLYIQSEIMHIKLLGLEDLDGTLLRVTHSADEDIRWQPAAHYAGMLIQDLGIVALIFHQQSHAAILAKSHGILEFLVAKGHMSASILDLIWNFICSNRQSDMIQAAFLVIAKIVELGLGPSGNMHLLLKFGSLSLDQFSKQHMQLFTTVMVTLDTEQLSRNIPGEHLKVVRMLISLYALIETEKSEACDSLEACLDAALHKCLDAGMDYPHLKAFISECRQGLQQPEGGGKGYLEALVVMLEARTPGIIEMLGLDEHTALPFAIEVLRKHVNLRRARDGNAPYSLLAAIALIMQLIRIKSDAPDGGTLTRLWDLIIGPQAAGPGFRDAGVTAVFKAFDKNEDTHGVLLHLCRDYLPELPAELAPPCLAMIARRLLAGCRTWGRPTEQIKMLLTSIHRCYIYSTELDTSHVVQEFRRACMELPFTESEQWSQSDMAEAQACLVRGFVATLGIDQTGSLRAVDVLNHALTLAINKAAAARSGAPTTLESEISGSYESISVLLDGPDDALALEAYRLLCRISPSAEASSLFESETWSIHEVFPVDMSVCRSLYSMSILRKVMRDETDEREAARTRVQAIRLLRDLLMRDLSELHRTLIQHASQVLSRLLEFGLAPPVRDCFAQSPRDFLLHCFDILRQTEKDAVDTNETVTSQWDIDIIRDLYRCIWEGVLCSASLREAFLGNSELVARQRELLSSRCVDASHQIALIMSSVCARAETPLVLVDYCWNIMSPLLRELVHETQISRPVFRFVPHVFDAKMRRSTPHDSDAIISIADQLFQLLLSIEHGESFAAADFIEYRVRGLAMLLRSCVELVPALAGTANTRSNATLLFSRFLFPGQSFGVDRLTPIMRQDSRAYLYNLIDALCSDPAILDDTLRSIRYLPCNSAANNGFYAGPEKELRSPCGYVGLGNLGQTCYLNSILQQLYVNVEFRRFIFDTPVDDEDKQQVLLYLQETFAYLQDAHGAVHFPTGLAKALDIDFGSQEDAHIFFTMLIGKLEDSMPHKHAQAKLRSFFGGRNRCQTRGACGHVSESTDDYYNLSLVVKGKLDLCESLQEYVQGAELQGGDRYKCLTCEAMGNESYVDAMRRTGLEHIPDDLVIGLKRFRYESYDGGTKVNDYFEFPAEIDMSPYKLASLIEDKPSPTDQDVFELVGVIVHQGTLQFGHYWAYARTDERQPKTWIDFNDERVTRRDLDYVLTTTRGGKTKTSSISSYDRMDSAYVLMYRRRQAKDLLGKPAPSIPSIFTKCLNEQNEAHIYRDHVFALDHLRFVVKLFRRLAADSAANSNWPSSDAIDIAVNYFHSMFIRQQDGQIIADFARVIIDMACSTVNNVKLVLRRLLSEPSYWLAVTRAARQASGDILLSCLSYLKKHSPRCYGIQNVRLKHDTPSLDDVDMFQAALHSYRGLLNMLPDHRNCWGSCLEVVNRLADLGPQETALVFDKGYFTWAVEALAGVNKYIGDWQGSNRSAPWDALASFVLRLLKGHVDLSTWDKQACDPTDQRIGLRERDWMLLLEDFEEDTAAHVTLIKACHDVCVVPEIEEDVMAWPAARLIATLLEVHIPARVRAHMAPYLTSKIAEEKFSEDEQNASAAIAAVCCVSNIDPRLRQDLTHAMISQYRKCPYDTEPLVAFMARISPTQPDLVFISLYVWLPNVMLHQDDAAVNSVTMEWFKDFLSQHPVITRPDSHASLRSDYGRLSTIQRTFLSAINMVKGRLNNSILTSALSDFDSVVELAAICFEWLELSHKDVTAYLQEQAQMTADGTRALIEYEDDDQTKLCELLDGMQAVVAETDRYRLQLQLVQTKMSASSAEQSEEEEDDEPEQNLNQNQDHDLCYGMEEEGEDERAFAAQRSSKVTLCGSNDIEDECDDGYDDDDDDDDDDEDEDDEYEDEDENENENEDGIEPGLKEIHCIDDGAKVRNEDKHTTTAMNKDMDKSEPGRDTAEDAGNAAGDVADDDEETDDDDDLEGEIYEG